MANTVKANIKINFKVLEQGVSQTVKGLQKMQSVLKDLDNSGNKASKTYSKFANSLEKFANNLNTTHKASQKLAQIQKDFKKTVSPFAGALRDSEEAEQALRKFVSALRTVETTKKRLEQGEYASVGESNLYQNIGRLENYLEQLKELTREEREAAEATERLKGKQMELGDVLQNVSDAGLARVGMETEQLAATLGITTAAATAVGVAFVGVSLGVKALSNYFKRVIKQTQDFGRQLLRINEAMRNTVSGIRLATQGVLSIARAMTFFVAVPLTAFLREGVKGAIELEEQLVRVQKVTGELFVDRGDLGEFRDQLLELSIVSASSASELAKYAEQLGQMGVRSKDAMMEFVAIMDVFSQSTDVGAEEVAQDLGSIANAFGMSLSEASGEVIQFVNSMAETINSLENAVGATASDIVQTMKDMGSSFAGLTAGMGDNMEIVQRMSFSVIAAWGAAAREMGMSADEAGTALRNLPSYMEDNADAIDKLNIKTDEFASTQEFVTGLHKDFQGTVLSLIDHLANNASTLEAVSASTDLLGRRSGRLLSNLVKMAKTGVETEDGMVRLNDIMEIANKAWEEGGGLMAEYDKMLATTSVGIKQARHALEMLGTKVGDDVLPILNRFLDDITAGFVALTDIYGTLDKATKSLIGKVLALTTAFGPVSWFLSQIAFGVSMLANGLMRVTSVIVPVLGAFKMLVTGLLTLNPILISIGGLLYSIFSQYTDQIQSIGTFIERLMTNLADDSKEWGEAVLGSFAEGIKSSAHLVIDSVKAIAESIAMFLEAHSPPMMGPLSTIDMWGEPLMNTWMEGFGQADFSLLSNAAQRAESILQSIHFTPSSEDDDSERKKVLKDLISFREEFSELLKLYRDGVNISQEYIDNVLSGLGEGSDELRELVELSLEYEQVQRRLQEIEEERTQISEAYKDRVEAIRMSGASAEDMVEQIASAQYQRDQQNKALSEEEQRLERREELLEKQISTQEAFMDALEEQSSLWQELLKMQADSGGAGDDAKDIVDQFKLGGEVVGEFDSKLQELRRRFIDMKVQAQKFKGIIFLAMEAVEGLWEVLIEGKTPEEAFADLEADVMEKADVVGHGEDLASEFWATFGEYNPEEDVLPQIVSFFKDTGPELINNMDENLNVDQMKTSVGNWLEDSFNLDESQKQEAMDAFGSSISDITTKLTPGQMAKFGIDPTSVLTPEEAETSPFESFISDSLQPLIDTGKELQKVFGKDGLIAIFQEFTQIFAKGFTGGKAPVPPMTQGMGFGVGPVEDAETKSMSMQEIAYTIGEFASTLVEHVPTIVDNLGKLAENLTLFIGALIGVEVEGETPIEKISYLVESLADLSEEVGSIDPAKFKLAGRAIKFAFFMGIGSEAKAGELVTDRIMENWKSFETWWNTSAKPWMGEAVTDVGEWIGDLWEEVSGWDFWAVGWGWIQDIFGGIKAAWNRHVKPVIDKLNLILSLTGLAPPGLSQMKDLSNLLSGKRQGGGPAMEGKPLLIGEGGTEAFSAPIRGHITSASLTGKMMNDAEGYGGGDIIQINIDNPTIRDDRDIDDLVDTVVYRLGER